MKYLIKKMLSGCIAALLALSTVSFASEDISVIYNGEKINFDVAPIIENDRTLVPMRSIFETLGCNVSYYQYDGKQTVIASKGGKFISLEIGDPKIVVDSTEITLDVAPKIVNNRTLVPLRAISEALDCKVSYDEQTKTVDIYRYMGQYSIKSEKAEKCMYADDGTLIMTISAYYPVVDNKNNDSFYTYINDYYKGKAEEFVKSYSEDFGEDAEYLYDEQDENFSPLECSSNFEITINRNDWLSITTYDYSNLGGAHPNMYMSSKTYQMLLGKEMSLSDVLCMEQEDTDKYVYDKFDEYIKSMEYTDGTDYQKYLDEGKSSVNFYVTDNSLVMYFNTYDILPYAFGAPSVEIPYSDSQGDVKIDISGYNLDEYKFALDGNYTTGYTWEYTLSDETVAKVESNYVPDENKEGMVGAGGKCYFTVTGLKEGDVSLECSYLRTFQENSAIEKYRYRFHISADNKITLISQRNITNTQVDEF